jgi:hypothetical protein
LTWALAFPLVLASSSVFAAAPAESPEDTAGDAGDAGDGDATETGAEEEAAPELSEEAKRAQQLFYDGSAQFSAADYTGAIEKFTEALKIVTSEGLDPTIRGALLINLARAHLKAYDVSRDVTHLRSAREIYSRIIREADRAGYSDDDIKESETGLEELDAKLAELEAQDSAPSPAPTSTNSEQDEGEAGGGKRTIGIALAASGGVLIAGGAGALGWGTTYESFAEDSVAESGEQGFESANEYIDQQKQRGQQWMIAGGAAAGVGLAVLVTGVVLIVKDGKEQKSAKLNLSPVVSRAGSGLVLTGRF